MPTRKCRCYNRTYINQRFRHSQINFLQREEHGGGNGEHGGGDLGAESTLVVVHAAQGGLTVAARADAEDQIAPGASTNSAQTVIQEYYHTVH